jgi:hypothetical protein
MDAVDQKKNHMLLQVIESDSSVIHPIVITTPTELPWLLEIYRISILSPI